MDEVEQDDTNNPTGWDPSDSSSDDEGFERKHPGRVEQEQLYDAHQDEGDAAWVDQQRAMPPQVNDEWKEAKTEDGEVYYISTKTNETAWVIPPWKEAKADGRVYYWNTKTNETSWTKPTPDNMNPGARFSTDAVLNCPGCFATLCLVCQRHTQHKGQYRAVLVQNVIVKTGEVLRYSHGGRAGAVRTVEPHHMSAGPLEDGAVHPVLCSTCNTEVGVRDQEEVYHFFNVLESEG